MNTNLNVADLIDIGTIVLIDFVRYTIDMIASDYVVAGGQMIDLTDLYVNENETLCVDGARYI